MTQQDDSQTTATIADSARRSVTLDQSDETVRRQPRVDSKPANTGRRSKRAGMVENRDYVAFCRRAIRAAGRRIADGDVDALPDLANLAHDLDQALTAAVCGLRAAGYSWTDIATRTGTTRQAAHQRWHHAA